MRQNELEGGVRQRELGEDLKEETLVMSETEGTEKLGSGSNSRGVETESTPGARNGKNSKNVGRRKELGILSLLNLRWDTMNIT